MNPFDLRGPEFLLFYVGCIAAGVGALRLARRIFEGGEPPKLSFGAIDPYLVAELRGGDTEALRVAVLSLIDRGLLIEAGDDLATAPGALNQVRRPLEREILGGFVHPEDASTALLQTDLCDSLREQLRQLNLVPSETQSILRFVVGAVVTGTLWWVAYYKIALASARGHHNIEFLVLLALYVPFLVFALQMRARATVRGEAFLADLQALFKSLKARAASVKVGGRTNELAMLAAIFGLDALAGDAWALAQAHFPKRLKAQSSGWFSNSSGCGSSCGSSCGGGCGGGCGGCGS